MSKGWMMCIVVAMAFLFLAFNMVGMFTLMDIELENQSFPVPEPRVSNGIKIYG